MVGKVFWNIILVILFSLSRLTSSATSDSTSSSNTVKILCGGSFFDKVENSCGMNLSTNFSIFWGGNVTDNNFFGTIFNSGKITIDQKNRVLERFNKVGRVGGGVKYNMSYFRQIGKDSTQKTKGVGMYFSIQEASQFNLKFSKEFYSLVFYGNKQYKGENVKFGRFLGSFSRFQTFKFGLTKRTEKFVFGMGFGLVSGAQNVNLKASKANLYTAKDPKELSLDLNMDVMRSDTNAKINFFNGQGISTDIYIKWNLFQGSSLIGIVEDFGFIHWSSRSIKARIEEKQFEFTGIEVKTLKDLTDSEIMYEYEDSLRKAYNVNYKKSSYSTVIPGKFMIAYRIEMNSLGLKAGLFRYLTPAHAAHYFIGMDQSLNGFVWNVNVGYGGYSNLSAGFGMGMVIAQQFGVRVAATNLLGVVMPTKVSGNFFEISMKYQII